MLGSRAAFFKTTCRLISFRGLCSLNDWQPNELKDGGHPIGEVESRLGEISKICSLGGVGWGFSAFVVATGDERFPSPIFCSSFTCFFRAIKLRSWNLLKTIPDLKTSNSSGVMFSLLIADSGVKNPSD